MGTSLLAVALVVAAGCGDALGTGAGRATLVLVPAFGELAAFADNADRLRIVVTRLADTTLVEDTTVAIDPATGEATADIRVQLSSASELFEVLLQAIRGSDAALLFEGVQTVSVTATSGATPIVIPVTYAGPTGAFLDLTPADTAIAPGTSFTYRAVVVDTLEAVVPVPVTFDLLTPGDSVILGIQRVAGIATAAASGSGTVRVVARTPDGLADTARVTVGQVAFSVSGTIRVGTTPLAGVNVVATGGHTQTVTTGATGAYTLTNVAFGATDIVITPSLAGYAFTPAALTVAGPVTADVTGRDFAAAAGLRVTPGYETISVGGTFPLQASFLDAGGAVIGPAAAIWTSRSPAVASVSATGVVTGASAGTAVVVGTSGSLADSMLVRVAAPGSVPVSAIADTYAFRTARVGDTVIVDVRVAMSYTGGELLGSYNAQLAWDPAVLRYVNVLNGTFGTPTINDTQTGQGSLRFSAANATGVGGSVVVARVRFVAQATGTTAPQLAISELSAAQTFTNLLSSVVVTNGSVTVRP
jgi:hypothetical protein